MIHIFVSELEPRTLGYVYIQDMHAYTRIYCKYPEHAHTYIHTYSRICNYQPPNILESVFWSTCVRMYVCMYVCMYACLRVSFALSVYKCMYVRMQKVWICMVTSWSLCIYVCKREYMYICSEISVSQSICINHMCVYMYIYMYVSMYMCICLHVWKNQTGEFSIRTNVHVCIWLVCTHIHVCARTCTPASYTTAACTNNHKDNSIRLSANVKHIHTSMCTYMYTHTHIRKSASCTLYL